MFTIHFKGCSPSNILYASHKCQQYLHKYCTIAHVEAKNLEDYTHLGLNYILVEFNKSDYSEEDIMELIMIMIESNSKCILAPFKNIELQKDFVELAKLYELSYLSWDTVSLESFTNLGSVIDFGIIDEIFFGVHNSKGMYSPLDYATHVTITDSEVILRDKRHPLFTCDFSSLYADLDVDALQILRSSNYFLSDKLISPIPFVVNSDISKLVILINDYKKQVFKKISNITPREISKLPRSVIQIFVEANYVPLDNIKQIVG